MSKKNLTKKTLRANLLAMAAEEAAQEHEHRSSFERLISSIRVQLESMTESEDFIRSSVNDQFGSALDIAKRVLRMSKQEFEAAVAVLNTAVSRVVDRCPSGRDTRDVPEWMQMTAEELRLSYDLMTPWAATGWIADHGAKVGYTAAQIAAARKEYKPLEIARCIKRDDEDDARARARRSQIEALSRASYQQRIAFEISRTCP
ncbi:hypothetical protein HJB51_29115 [Rhizobium lentis]|uniref:hypothetical protein n=1 Tax=Rhizobium lentis TaxID=1138194 RepID=UPI001C837725|nr:hypothetical protein [Rhizobium lentis]MBX5111994.1 hypothetical protein [Rhizobium lentis]